MNKIEYDAARTVTGLTRSVSIVNLLREIGWVSLSDRRYMQKLILVYKYKNGVLPDYLNDLFPVTVNEANPYNLRNNMDFVTLARRTEIYAKSVIPSSLKLWNELDENTRASDTLLSFKSKVKAKFKPPVVPQYYLLGNRCEQIHHARLRNKCSNLSGDLHRNHISDSPRCDCGHNYEMPIITFSTVQDLLTNASNYS